MTRRRVGGTGLGLVQGLGARAWGFGFRVLGVRVGVESFRGSGSPCEGHSAVSKIFIEDFSWQGE